MLQKKKYNDTTPETLPPLTLCCTLVNLEGRKCTWHIVMEIVVVVADVVKIDSRADSCICIVVSNTRQVNVVEPACS